MLYNVQELVGQPACLLYVLYVLYVYNRVPNGPATLCSVIIMDRHILLSL